MEAVQAQWGVVVVAAGRGMRMGTKESKQYLLLQDKPILVHTLELFEGMEEVSEIILVVGEQDVARCEAFVREYDLIKVKAVLAGGSERQHSVRIGLQSLGTEWVMVHDGVRPLVTQSAVRSCMSMAENVEAAVLAVPVKDTIKQVNEAGVIVATPDRRSLWAIQTPQAFRRSLLIRAHEQAALEGFLGTDDAMVVERLGIPVSVTEGEYTNIKITTPEDLPWAAFLLASNSKSKTGKGEKEL
ncbi:2-C-methyl-D-erythritol 4-phosphate cytidylyltransferase [Paenibacillus baekrokdamisoli]|uniref:2-C-methyl-D-erythritol 4-phosphate cytidylyltransferase n=1 Tax=Paenibacillus baekrokdamisoli TaxID=1712516 RepID=A0A3G9J093_9BACL|nr:2-C-methyl-D-erythritol 4-phosphate cytidylyltransferase [Paenibacillus baekrokdamisoli]MBB3073147.1 2-C-methyl-D-erythritol 4-phosphate cytidylyltransferase [Paenibacillus baekrokdamisoli]BBH23972.1 2-C-methyl-D-erythritol 4-phosphate cytidylyltransferase [Paenibacillus baekrokdamisoli]